MRTKHLLLIAFIAIIPCVAAAQEVFYARVGGYVDLPNPTPPGDYQLIESRFYAKNSNNIDVASGTSRVYILKYFTGNEVVTCDYTCVRQWLSGGRIYEDRKTNTTYYYIQCLDSQDPTPPNPPTPINDDNFYFNTIEGVPMQFYIWTGSEVSVMESCIGYANGRITIPSSANGYSVTYIANAAFWNIAGLTELVIPSTVNSVDDYIALGCDNLKTIICEALYPPKTGKNPTITDNCWSSTLYVPKGAKTRYESADGWSKFGTILEIGDEEENEEEQEQESLSLNYTSRTIYTGYGCKLIPQISPEDMKTTYTWKSSDRTVATVSDGYVYAKSEGTTIITCETKSGTKATCNITVVSAKKGKTTVEIKNKISNLDVLVRATQMKLSK